MQIFLKKIQSQEWGYSGSKPNQRGKYLLIPKLAWSFFPDLSNSIRNSSANIRIVLPSKIWVDNLYVWHNAKFFPEFDRNHDERRLYSNKIMNDELGLDRNVIISISRVSNVETDYNCVSIKPDDAEYVALSSYLNKKNMIIENSQFVKKFAPETVKKLIFTQDSSVPDNLIFNDANKIFDPTRSILNPYLDATIKNKRDTLIAVNSKLKTEIDVTKSVPSNYKKRNSYK